LGVPEKRPARRSHCPHCGKETPTVRGVCTNCWGSKGGRLFTVEKRGPRGGGEDPWFWPWGCSSTALVIAGIALSSLSGWI
jgi:hypothetical protein